MQETHVQPLALPGPQITLMWAQFGGEPLAKIGSTAQGTQLVSAELKPRRLQASPISTDLSPFIRSDGDPPKFYEPPSNQHHQLGSLALQCLGSTFKSSKLWLLEQELFQLGGQVLSGKQGHTQWCSRLIPGSEHRDHSWWVQVRFQGCNLDQQCTVILLYYIAPAQRSLSAAPCLHRLKLGLPECTA